MKRTKQQVDDEDTGSADDESHNSDEEMDVEEAAEPVGHVTDSENDEEEANDPPPASNTEHLGGSSFFDTFYGLSSSDQRERAHAAKEMLEHCLIGPAANVTDASYALKRLLNGVCSGRAAARQGNASALAMFLKISFVQGNLKEIQMESSDEEKEKRLSLLAFVRHRLLQATEPGIGKRKGSEDRDYKFGRLFGILSVVKSGIMLPVGDDRAEAQDIMETVTGFVNDLIDLYSHKKWMREPAAHAIGTLLSSYYATSKEGSESQTIVDHLVQSIISPKLLVKGDYPVSHPATKMGSYSAEQVALALHIQAHIDLHSSACVAAIDLPLLTPDNIHSMSAALAETSSVPQPRIHFVWDAFVSYISKPIKMTNNIQERELANVCPPGDSNPADLIAAVLRHVIIEHLLGLQDGQQEAKTTHERSALGLCIIKHLAGVEFTSAVTGQTRLLVDNETLEHVIFEPRIVKYLFLNVLGAGLGGNRKQTAHMLRPMALQVLESATQSLEESDTARRIAIVRALLRCDSRFDSKSKTNYVEQLTMLTSDNVDRTDDLWEQYSNFLQLQLLKASNGEMAGTLTPYEAQGYVDLLFQYGRALLRTKPQSSQMRENMFEKIESLLYFMLCASFFDCGGVAHSSSPKKKSKKQKENNQPIVKVAHFVKQGRGEHGLLPYQIRCMLSARFYSLLAESFAAIMHSSSDKRENDALGLLSSLVSTSSSLKEAGAKRLHSEGDNENENDESYSTLKSVLKRVEKVCEKSTDTKMQKLAISCSILGTVLHLQLLCCGPADELDEEDIDEDAENDFEEVSEFLAGIQEVSDMFLNGKKGTEKDPLESTADLCAAILSSPIAAGSQSKGGLPRLLRDAVKMLWVGALSSRASVSEARALNAATISVLLQAIGAEEEEEEGDQAMDVEDESDEESNDDADEDSDDSTKIFTKAVSNPDVLEKSLGDMTRETPDSDEEDSEEVDINPDRLKSFLEEDSDAEVDETELEHHEGADAALAKLIQIKQEARKAGQVARERTESARHLRCFLLLETLLNGKPDGWGSLFRTDIMLPMIFPLLRYRRMLENGILKETGKLDEKRVMLDKITSLLKLKLFKLKLLDRQWNDPSSGDEVCTAVAAKIVDQMRGKISKEQRICCSLALTTAIRSVPDALKRIDVAMVYQEIAHEWSDKKTTRLESYIFEDFIHLCPVVAQATLSTPLSRVLVSGRSSYLKTEAARILSLLYNPNLNPRNTELEQKAFEHLCESLGRSLESFAQALLDPETKKSKRGKEVVKAIAKVFSFAAATGASLPPKELDLLKKHLEQLKSDTESAPLEQACDKVLKQVSELEVPKTNEPERQTKFGTDENEAADDDSDSSEVHTLGKGVKKSKSKKNKSKKKRR